MATTLDDEVADLRRANAELQRRLDEALAERDEGEAQRAAMAEILEVINASPGDPVPVFDAMLEKATRLCDAAYGQFWTYDGVRFHPVTMRGNPAFSEWVLARGPLTPGQRAPHGRIVQGERFVHISDALKDEAYHSQRFRESCEVSGTRTQLVVPLRNDEMLLGVIHVYRREVRPFTDKQIALLQNFAAQAVIAMENARLVTEMREALEQQTATAEVLQVINASPGDLVPVFDAILEKAHRLCGAQFGALLTYDGEFVRLLAERNLPPAWADLVRGPWRPRHDHPVAQLMRGEPLFQVDDMAELARISDDPMLRSAVELGGIRTLLLIPLSKDGAFLGYVTAYRQEVRPFTDKQIALLQNFAAQAVIAMENARLLTETREALEQQTATSEVLQVINSSPGDLAPVFEAMLDRALRLCEAAFGIMWTLRGDVVRIAAMRDVPEAFAKLLAREPPSVTSDTFLGRAVLERSPIYVADCLSEEPYRNRVPLAVAAVELGGTRSMLIAPLIKDASVLGAFTVFRPEVRPFSDKQIALLENFAAQAVIAMENARLITETREALEQQTATAEVLQVINSSPGDLAPVFDAMLEKATRLCEATFGIMQTYDGERFEIAALQRVPVALAEWQKRKPPVFGPGTSPARLMSGEDLVHTVDLMATEAYERGDPSRRALVDLGGARSHLIVALRKESVLLGTIAVYRQEVRPFSDKQTALLQNFAAQAVIAMENARLITETREALEQQTATAEVLQVINSSPGDLSRVFEAILEKAHSLCDSGHGTLFLRDGDYFRPAAMRGVPEPIAERLRSRAVGADAPLIRPLLSGERFVHTVDLAQVDHPMIRVAIESGVRTLLSVPLRKEDELFGMIVAARFDARPFTEKQIALLENFAAQAVIAMENARLLTETREALEQQTATAEVLQVINSSPGDLAPVFNAMLEKAVRLCNADQGALFRRDGEVYCPVAHVGLPPEYHGLRTTPGNRSVTGQALLSRQVVQVTDLTADPEYAVPETVTEAMARTGLGVPLLREGEPIGVFGLARRRIEPFTERQIELVRTFADQAAIAIENARLITETREALEQQTATTEVLQVINSSPGDLVPVFEAVLEKAVRLSEAVHGHLWRYDGEFFHPVASHGDPRFAQWFAQAEPVRPPPVDSDGFLGRVVRGERVLYMADVRESQAYRAGNAAATSLADFGGGRSVLTIALRKDDAVLGAMTVYRQEVRPFSDRQIALLENFAAQAVIAMENARLLTETREALEQQTATAEVLGVINSSPGDLAPVFDKLIETAARLCDAEMANLASRDGNVYRPVAAFATSREATAFLRGLAIVPGRGTISGRALLERKIVHIADIAADPEYALPEAVTVMNYRTTLGVPLVREGEPIGVITLARSRVAPFTERQIALVENFAAQAVIAMENARLIIETHEALEQQTATAEVLGVINSSPGDLAPVFEAMLEKATRLCEAIRGFLWIYNGDYFRSAATRGVSQEFADFLRNNPSTGQPGSDLDRLIAGNNVVHRTDFDPAALPATEHARAFVELGGAKTSLMVALRNDSSLLGAITVYRQEPKPFSERQIALLQNFAAQAVIAIENARLLNEIRQRQSELRVTFDNMADGVVMFDEDLRLAAWNRNFQEVLDLSDALLAERPSYADYLRILAERGEFGTDDIEAELSRRLEDTDQELRLERTRPDGRVIEVRRNAVAGGGFVLIYSDITERKRSEAEIRAARDAAEAAYRDLKAAQASLIQAEKMASLGQLTAGIAHEIKNPLNFVNNFAGLSVELLDELKETAAPAVTALDNDKRTEIDETIQMLTGNLVKIAEHGRRADNIVKSMLEHSRGSSGERRSVDLNSLIEEALNLAYHGARAQDQSFNVTLERDYAARIAPIELVPQDITRVCLNLFSNGFYAAARRQQEGGDLKFQSTLKVTTCELGEAVEIRIRDNGIGIPPEIKDKLFQPFFTTKPTGEGTGLGLSISYDIVTQQHSGTIAVDSRVGEFTEFTVRLPRTYRARTAEAAS
jgi:GAF domain-containing protein